MLKLQKLIPLFLMLTTACQLEQETRPAIEQEIPEETASHETASHETGSQETGSQETASPDPVSTQAASGQTASIQAAHTKTDTPVPEKAAASAAAYPEKPAAAPSPTNSGYPGRESENTEDSPNEGATMTEAADADVTFVRAIMSDDGSWTFEVTVIHPDTGWEDYADGWDVVLPNGAILKTSSDDPFTRLLLHPHVGEQPFTRSQSRLKIPAEVESVTVRAHDIVDGFGGHEVLVNLMDESGPDFIVARP